MESAGGADGVGEADEDALLAPDSLGAQHCAKTCSAIGELTVGPASIGVDAAGNLQEALDVFFGGTGSGRS